MRPNIHARALPVASPSKAPKEMIATTMIIQLIPSLSRQKTNADERANTATSRIVKTNLTCIPQDAPWLANTPTWEYECEPTQAVTRSLQSALWCIKLHSVHSADGGKREQHPEMRRPSRVQPARRKLTITPCRLPSQAVPRPHAVPITSLSSSRGGNALRSPVLARCFRRARVAAASSEGRSRQLRKRFSAIASSVVRAIVSSIRIPSPPQSGENYPFFWIKSKRLLYRTRAPACHSSPVGRTYRIWLRAFLPQSP